ncbi:unnamed protein product [Didymodactylos carnosus]|uniref:S1/P1 Nuclease n=1 Tax=Didymodactylos carnosus TaxID=1234261 RepID=A0A815H059_9BILA|nr:unnamed protein product [Didymodactylos carnosus]CAF4209215.1 unnamed protein product [Didymodactylos carnosus]
MKITKYVLLFLTLITRLLNVYGWGIWAHKHISKAAILTLPQQIGIFFDNHADFIVEESFVPDIRKHLSNESFEYVRHHIYLEEYDYRLTVHDMPQTMFNAQSKYGQNKLLKHGVLPWNIDTLMNDLTDAFKKKIKTEILYIASELSHFIADAHVPFHVSIVLREHHYRSESLWEAELPELFGKHYNLSNGNAVVYINDSRSEIWNIIRNSYQFVNELLMTEQKLNNLFKTSRYKKKLNGELLRNVYNRPIHTKDYAIAYNSLLDGMVEEQIRKSIYAIASFWYTAWIDAGQPDMHNLDPEYLTRKNAKVYTEDRQLYAQTGKIFDFINDNEY